MSYTITVQVYQTNTNAFFHVVEKTVFTNGAWTSTNDAHVLTIGASGTSGSLRFVSDTGENFIVTLGVHNYAPWGDIVADFNPATQTALKITPEYYETEWGGTGKKDRVAQRWKTLASYDVSWKERKYAYKYTVTEGHNLKVNVVIG